MFIQYERTSRRHCCNAHIFGIFQIAVKAILPRSMNKKTVKLGHKGKKHFTVRKTLPDPSPAPFIFPHLRIIDAGRSIHGFPVKSIDDRFSLHGYGSSTVPVALKYPVKNAV